MIRQLIATVCLVLGMAGVLQSQVSEADNLVWTSPSQDEHGSMPLGNGDIGINFWVEAATGDLVFYIGKTDAWDGNGSLLKVGRVRISFTPVLFKEAPFKQELRLLSGDILVSAGNGSTARVWVDANNPVIRVETESGSDYNLSVTSEVWRRVSRDLGQGEEGRMAYGIQRKPAPAYPVILHPDVILPAQDNAIAWVHRNTHSIYDTTLSVQGVGDLTTQFPDPLINNTFGALIKGAGLASVDDTTLSSSAATRQNVISIYPFTAQAPTLQEWQSSLQSGIQSIETVPIDAAYAAHAGWWNSFWNRSWIQVSGEAAAETVTRGYNLQRMINAGAGRGKFAIKFNGTIFTVATKFQPDYRNWGGNYWWQNTRLPYWTMPFAGDYDLMQTMFGMYLKALPMCKARTQRYYSHDGAFYPETMYFWGTHNNANYGWTEQRGGLEEGTTVNRFIRYEWTSGIELTHMMLDYYDHRGGEAFLRDTLLPIASETITFYDQHWQRRNDGKIHMFPSNSLEDIWDATNPTPDIAGLRSIIPRLLDLSTSDITDNQRAAWAETLNDLISIPIRGTDPQYLWGEEGEGDDRGSEHPELYPVFPFTHYSVGRPNLDIGIETFNRRENPEFAGWRQHAIFAAMLGLTDEAKSMVSTNFATNHVGSRFPAFWGPNFDWVPDQDHGGVNMIALQRMLMHTKGDTVILLPAWPEDWDVDFRLRAPGNTHLTGKVRAGSLTEITVKPRARVTDIFVGQELSSLDTGIVLPLNEKSEMGPAHINIRKFSDKIILNLSRKALSVKVYNLTGEIVFRRRQGRSFILTGLHSGLYFVEAETRHGKTMARFSIIE